MSAITPELKSNVRTALLQRRENFAGSDKKYASSYGINPAQYNRLKKGEIDRVISDANWISLARQLELPLKGRPDWNVAKTPVFIHIQTQLTICQDNSMSCLLCDEADIGKTFTAKWYEKNHRNVVYVDCSQVKTKQRLVRTIARKFGVGNTGKYVDVYEDLVYYLRSIECPMVILDEAGDLQYDAFLELKALWNATEGCCGWMMMGADGLKEKVRRAIDNKKVGYTEIFSRYGKRYQRVTPEGIEERRRFLQQQAIQIIKANAPTVDVQKLVVKTEGSLRRIQKELSKTR